MRTEFPQNGSNSAQQVTEDASEVAELALLFDRLGTDDKAERHEKGDESEKTVEEHL